MAQDWSQELHQIRHHSFGEGREWLNFSLFLYLKLVPFLAMHTRAY